MIQYDTINQNYKKLNEGGIQGLHTLFGVPFFLSENN